MARCFAPLGFVGILFLLGSPVAAAPIHVRGQVVVGSRGFAGARVELLAAPEGYAEAVRRLRGEADPPPLATVRSNAEGFFEIAAPQAGAYRLRLRADGYLAMESFLVPLIEDADLEPATLFRAEPFQVRVVAAAGRPVPGVALRVDPGRETWGQSAGWSLEERGGVTDAGGRLVLSRGRGERLRLLATSPAYLGQAETLGEEGWPMVLTSRPAARLQVQGGDGHPVAGALLRWRSWPLGVTGPDGRLEVSFPAGDEPLTVEDRDGQWAAIPIPAAANPGPVLVRLKAPRILDGRVVQAGSAAPLANAFVWTRSRPLVPPAQTGADGGFRLTLSTPREVALKAAAPAYLPAEGRCAAGASTAPIVLRLEPAAGLSGQVVDEAGQPVSGAALEVLPSPQGALLALALRSGPAGRFQLSGLSFQTSYEVKASRQGFVPGSLKVRTPSPGQPAVPLKLVLKAGQTAFGRVVSETGTPVAGAALALFGEPVDSRGVFQAVSDAGGRFEIRALAAGRFTLWVRAEGFPPLRRTVEVPAAPARADLGEVQLPAGARVEGQVTDTHGAPLMAASVWMELGLPFEWLVQNEEPKPSAETGADGHFRVLVPRGRPVQLRVEHDGYVPLQVPGVEAPTREPLHLALKAARGLVGRIVGPDGEPVADADLTRVEELRWSTGGTGEMSASESPLNTTTDARGLFRLTGLEPGALDLRVAAQGYATRTVRGVSIPQDRDLEGLEIVLDRWHAFRVRVLSPTGEPVAYAMVNAEPDPPHPPRPADMDLLSGSVGFGHTDEQGTGLVEVPAPGRYRLTVRVELRTTSFFAQAGRGTTPVELRLSKGYEISGRVTDPQGRGLAGVALLFQGTQGSLQAATGEDGSFALQDVADGSFSLTAQKQGFLQSGGPHEVTVEGRDVHGLEVELSEGDGASLTGRLLGLSSEEILQTEVRATSSSGWQAMAEVTADGQYRIRDLSPGDWQVVASIQPENRSVQAAARIEAGASESLLDLDFGKGATLSGRVLLDGAPLAGAEVVMLSTSGNHATARSAYDGQFQLRGLKPGPAFLMIIAARGALGYDRTVEIDGDGDLTIEIQTGVLRGQVSAEATGEPVTDATIRIQRTQQGPASFLSTPGARSGEDGTFETRLAAGAYKVTVQKAGYAPAEATAEVRPGAAGSLIEIRLKPVAPP
ncbi:MAG TPA: carboxypeptidase-like regulatory domain-containing protein [Thermoanaerobaculia bacterium]|jgi:hypothetical protein|nr:carboxypeptidase-like regulatory domain-containing protein [Thermoanaerobaculia bacterium]